MLKKSVFFDFLNRRDGVDFETFMAESVENEHYINWNEFLLPHDYGDAEIEYFAIRNSCAIFDVSPIRKIRVRGSGAGNFFDHLVTRPVSDLPSMRATYVVFCAEDGSLKDDAILYKFADDDYLLMPSDVDHSPYFESLCRQLEISGVAFEECTDTWAGLAIQGPKSASALLTRDFADVEQIEPFEMRDYTLNGSPIKISRMGFTADLGYECWFEPHLADAFKQLIQSTRSAMDIELPGYSPDALEVCRLEGGFIVAGWDCATELDPQSGFERSPVELGLGWLVNLDAADFVGRNALLEQKKMGHRFTLRHFEFGENNKPDDGAEIYTDLDGNDVPIGTVNCSSWSFGLNKTIGNASIKSKYAKVETAWILLDGKRLAMKLSGGPFINLERRYQVPAPLDR